MKISNTPPPNYEEIRKHFPEADITKGTLFTYGDTCHCEYITDDLVVHEETHVRQQNGDPEAWWELYFADPQFRFEQELEAYRNQYKWVEQNISDRNGKYRILRSIGVALSGPLYGNLCSLDEAMKAVRLSTYKPQVNNS